MNEFNDSHYDKGTLMIHAIKFPGGYLSEMQAIYTSSLCPEYLSKSPLDAIRLKSLTESEIEVVNKLISMFGGLIVLIEGNYTVNAINPDYKQIEKGLIMCHMYLSPSLGLTSSNNSCKIRTLNKERGKIL